MMVYRYYCKYRPPMPGSVPKQGLVNIGAYDWPQKFDGIPCGVWGYVEYSRRLTEREIADYELVEGRNNPLRYY